MRVDIQELLTKVTARLDDDYSARFPNEMPSRVEVEMTDGTMLSRTVTTYKGFFNDPLEWPDAYAKFSALVTPFTGADLRDQIAAVIRDLDDKPIAELTQLLAKVPLRREQPTG